jgi:hypothetical protein
LHACVLEGRFFYGRMQGIGDITINEGRRERLSIFISHTSPNIFIKIPDDGFTDGVTDGVIR